MKKILCLLMTMFFSAVFGLCVFASTSVAIESAQQASTGEINVECSISNASSSQAITVLSYKSISEDEEDSDGVIYADQFTADISDGSFTFDFLPASWTDTNSVYIVKVGGYGIDETDSMLISFYEGKIYKAGDIDGDDDIDDADAALLLKYLADLNELSSGQIAAGDYNSDSSVDMLDVVEILQSQSE